MGLAMLVVAGAMLGCANTGITHVNADEFIRLAGTGEQMNSVCGTFYIGTSANRAYVERTGLYRMFRLHKAMVCWTELDALPTDVTDALRLGKPPWTPWQEKMKKANQASQAIGAAAPQPER